MYPKKGRKKFKEESENTKTEIENLKKLNHDLVENASNTSGTSVDNAELLRLKRENEHLKRENITLAKKVKVLAAALNPSDSDEE